MKSLFILTGPALVCLGIDTRKADVPAAAITTIQSLPICLGILVIVLLILRLARSSR